jgi:radical SAM protein with 4Fe4S-binding SPASM domain
MHNLPTSQENLENVRSLRRLFVAQRIPVSGSINLTHRCNLNCVHCYLGDRSSKLRSAKEELNTDQWLSVIDQITKAGCLSLLLSGGEVFLRPDFKTIYRKAVNNGFLVTVFTNGTLINEDIISLFLDLPPQSVEITLYGATRHTYESITGVKGSFKKCLNGIQKLHERQIRFTLKTIILTHNLNELDKIMKIAHDFGVDFRMDPAISPCLDSSKFPLRYRVDPAEAVKADFADMDRAKRWNQYYNEIRSRVLDTDNLYNCGAGLTNFHIDPAGNLLPCMMLKKPTYDLKKGAFIDGWNNEIQKLRTIKASSKFKCNQCDKRSLCGSCPAIFELENDSPEIHSQYICELGENRLKAITQNLSVEDCTLT